MPDATRYPSPEFADWKCTATGAQQEPIPPADDVHFICGVGPCRWYVDMIADSRDANAEPELRAYCTRVCTPPHGQSELFEMTDCCVYACSYYSPPWWSRAGRARQRRNRRALAERRAQLAGAKGRHYG